MEKIWEIYTDNIHANLKPFYANWPPNFPIALGDFGLLQGNMFLRKDSLKSAFGIDVRPLRHPGDKTTYAYRSAGSTEVKFHPKAQAQLGPVPVKASVAVSFKSKSAIFFQAAGCEIEAVDGEVALGDAVLQLLAERRWNPDWHIVTRLVRAGATTMIVSAEGGASIVLEADAEVPTIDLADASIGLSIAHEKSIGWKAITEKARSPLIGFSKVKPRWFRNTTLDPIAIAGGGGGGDTPTIDEILMNLGDRPVASAFSFERVGDEAEAPSSAAG